MIKARGQVEGGGVGCREEVEEGGKGNDKKNATDQVNEQNLFNQCVDT